jgi:hypothetical protein
MFLKLPLVLNSKRTIKNLENFANFLIGRLAMGSSIGSSIEIILIGRLAVTNVPSRKWKNKIKSLRQKI